MMTNGAKELRKTIDNFLRKQTELALSFMKVMINLNGFTKEKAYQLFLENMKRNQSKTGDEFIDKLCEVMVKHFESDEVINIIINKSC